MGGGAGGEPGGGAGDQEAGQGPQGEPYLPNLFIYLSIYLFIYLSIIVLTVRFAVLTAATWPATSPPSARTRPCPRGVTIARWRQSGTFDKLDYTLPNGIIFSP